MIRGTFKRVSMKRKDFSIFSFLLVADCFRSGRARWPLIFKVPRGGGGDRCSVIRPRVTLTHAPLFQHRAKKRKKRKKHDHGGSGGGRHRTECTQFHHVCNELPFVMSHEDMMPLPGQEPQGPTGVGLTLSTFTFQMVKVNELHHCRSMRLQTQG